MVNPHRSLTQKTILKHKFMRKKTLIITTVILFTGILHAQNKSESEMYLKEQKKVLNNFKPISFKIEQQLDSVFWNKWEGHKKMKIAFHQAMCIVLNEKNYFNQYFKDELEQRAWLILNDDLVYYKQIKKLSDNELNEIKSDLDKKSKDVAYIEFRHFNNSKKRFDEKKKVDEKYRNRISKITLKSNTSASLS